jgi:hypothetical protein
MTGITNTAVTNAAHNHFIQVESFLDRPNCRAEISKYVPPGILADQARL